MKVALRWWALLSFAAPSVPLAALALPLVVYLPNYYATTIGLDLATVGAAFTGVRLLALAFDPLCGVALDRTNWRFGRCKTWLSIAAPGLMIATYMLFLARPGVSAAYLWGWLVVVYLASSMAVLAQTAWGSALSTDQQVRSQVFAYWQSGNVVGMILIMILPIAINLLPGPLERFGGVRGMGGLIVGAIPLMIGVCVATLGEPKRTSMELTSRASLSDYFSLLRRPSVLRILIADVTLGAAPGITGSLFFFYFERMKGFTRTQTEPLILVYLLVAVFGAPLWAYWAKGYDKHKVLIAAAIVYMLTQTGVALTPDRNIWVAAVILTIAGLPYSAAAFLLRSMMADISDEERSTRGVDCSGILFSLLSGTTKLGIALAGAALVILGCLGFNAKRPELSSHAGYVGLTALYIVTPMALGLIAIGAMSGFSIGRHPRDTVVSDLLSP